MSERGDVVLPLPFRLRGHEGIVEVNYGINDDPAVWGFDLFDLPFDPSLVCGFPLMLATVHYDGPGYLALMDWIQVVTVTPDDSSAVWALVDVYRSGLGH
jgi:hypothetical protein